MCHRSVNDWQKEKAQYVIYFKEGKVYIEGAATRRAETFTLISK